MHERNKQLSRRFTELFSPDGPAVEEVFRPDMVIHDGSDGEVRGLEEMRGFVAAYRAAFADARSTVEQQIAEGDLVVTRWRATGTHTGEFQGLAPTMRRFAFTGVTIERIEGDRIVEVWVHRDDLGLLRQLGVVPATSPASPAAAR
jgi:predicted ester cyclase